MIAFSCNGCGKTYSVSDALSGRRGRCKSCGEAVVVPAATARLATGTGIATLPVRTRRLLADARQVAEAFENSPFVRVHAVSGNPPDVYEVEYSVNGLAGAADNPAVRDNHRAEIRLTSLYPKIAPQCRMLTPIFHPNIDTSAICVGDHWAAGERLVDLIVKIGEMIAYQAYNIKSPLNGEAAMWADLNVARLPIDARDLRAQAVKVEAQGRAPATRRT
jgi:ubiquitin-protein ligase